MISVSSIFVIFACQTCPVQTVQKDTIDVVADRIGVVQDFEFFKKEDKETEPVVGRFNFDPIDQSSSAFYLNNQAYKTIAEQISRAGYSPAYQNIISKRLARKSQRQARLPQVSNEISYTDSDDVLARIDVDQVIFGNGKFTAQKRVLSAGEAKAVAEYEIETNGRIEEGLLAFANAANNYRRLQEIDAFIEIYGRFLKMADARVKGGVANRNEFRLFELKQAQAKAERLRYFAEFRRYKGELEALTTTSFSEVDFELFERQSSLLKNDVSGKYTVSVYDLPEYRIAEADIEERMGELDVEKAAYRPELSVRASFGHDTNFGAIGNGFDTDARLVLRISKPLYWGKNLDVKALRNDVQSAKTQLLQTHRELTISKNVFEGLLESYQSQLKSNREVANLAKTRRNSFDQDFKAGAVSMAEAVSILETAKTVQFQYLESLFLLQSTEIEFARSLGVLGPVDVDPKFKEDEFDELIRNR